MPVGTMQFVEGLKRTQRWRRPSSPALALWRSWLSGLWALTGTDIAIPLGLRPLCVDRNYTTDFPRPPVYG